MASTPFHQPQSTVTVFGDSDPLGKQVVMFLIGRKGVGFYKFRGRPVEMSWTGLLSTWL